MIVYRDMDQAALDAAYDNRAAVPHFPRLAEERLRRGAEVRSRRRCHADLPYGERPRERLDFFPAADSDAPVLFYVHGGYWQWTEKEASTWLVEGPLARGFAVALVEYTLAPQATMAQIVAEIDRALSWVAAHAGSLRGDPRRIHVAGHSAGGHLTAMMLGHPATASALPISGLFDLEPIRLSNLNHLLGLDPATAAAWSPQRHLPATAPPLVVSVGAAELPELQRQSAEYAAAMQANGCAARLLALAGHDHFSILDELARPDGKLCDALCALDAEVMRTRAPRS